MEEIKTLERIIEQYEECKRNCEEFTVNSTALYREEYEAIENLINKYKEQEKEIDVLKALVKENQSTIECYKELLKESK